MKKPASQSPGRDELIAAQEQLKAINQQLAESNRQLRSAEEALHRSREQYKTMFEGTINAIAVYEAVDDGNDFILRNFNPSAERIERVKKEDLLGRSVLEVLPSVREFGLFDVLQRVWKSGKPEYYSETIHKDGRITGWREDYVYKLPSGEIVVIYEDITEHRRAEEMRAEEHNLLRSLIDNMPDLIYIKDKRSRFVIANTAVTSFMGAATPDELVGKTDFDFYPEQQATAFYEDEQNIILLQQPIVNKEESFPDKQGGPKWLLTTKVPWTDSHGNIVGIMGIGRDITELKLTKEALRAANQQLEAVNQQLRADEQQLRAANQQLRAGEQQLSAANQQLQAANEQLRASEQQLKATNQQLEAANQQLHAGEQQLRAANQQLRAGEEELRRLNHDLQKRVRELDCLYGLSRLDENRRTSLEQIFKKLVDMVPTAWEYPAAAVARIVFENVEFKTDNFKQTPWMQSADIKMNKHKAGVIEVYYLEEKPEVDEGPFFVEERSLLEALAERLGDIAERKRAEEKLFVYQAQLKSLASELTLTEERERRRIATELHDRIGQLLVISKVKLGALREFEQSDEFTGAVNEICDSLDQSIQNTRSLTFDLSSPILYELGFEAAVAEWLDEQIREKHGIETEFIDDGQPKPLDDDISVLLFRDVRELLINVVKHAQADKVKVAVRRIDNEIYVSVEDDGVGFNISEITSIATKTRGFGLFSIRERLEQLGGRLEIDSKPGCGTRVTVIAPLKQGNVDDNKR
jgi:PAS domain S-box-containing protein